MSKVLVATPEPIGDRLAGPAIRAAHIARVLGAHHNVTLVSLAGASTSPIDGREVFDGEAIDPDMFDAAVVQGRVTIAHPELLESEIPLVIDWFDPFHLEALHRANDDRILRRDLIEGARVTLLEQARRGDFFLCSNHVQRAHWLGWLAAAGRVNHHNHDSDPQLNSIITVAPFGLDRELRDSKATPIRETFPIIGPDDPVIVWGGGLHDWLDPVSIVHAMPLVLEENPDSRLVFLAGPHPNTSIETMGVRGETIAAARELKLFAKHVLFVNQWVPYEDRLAWLADASIGVVAHRDHLETANSHRTRLVDHLAVGLPTVSTSGDPGSDLLLASGAAVVVPPEDPELMGEALAEVIRNHERRGSMGRAARTLASTMRWEQTLDPLVSWMRSPAQAPDRRAGLNLAIPAIDGPRAPLERALERAKLHADDGGYRQVMERAVQAGRRRIGR